MPDSRKNHRDSFFIAEIYKLFIVCFAARLDYRLYTEIGNLFCALIKRNGRIAYKYFGTCVG